MAIIATIVFFLILITGYLTFMEVSDNGDIGIWIVFVFIGLCVLEIYLCGAGGALKATI